MRIWFWADTHFHHKAMITYCNRPFRDVEEMNETLINNYNALVKPEDETYFLGDFSFGGANASEEIVKRLKGKKYLIRGNHDHKHVIKRITPYFIWVKDVYQLTVQDTNTDAPDTHMSVYPHNNQMIWLSHYPHVTWPQEHYGTLHLHGHSHGGLPDDPTKRRLDVGVDCFNYKPVSYETIKELMAKKTWKCTFKEGKHEEI
jgi:calcineurin-like phosphoesterase family protein